MRQDAMAAIVRTINHTSAEFTPDSIAYNLRFSHKVTKYDVLNIIGRMPTVKRISYTLYRVSR